MLQRDKKTHTTINLSNVLIREAGRLLDIQSKTAIIHEALRRVIESEKLRQHALEWVGKGRIHDYE